MASTFTPGLNLEKPASGEQDNAWGTTLNGDLDKIDAGMAWQVVQTQVLTSQNGAVVFALPTRYTRFRLEFLDLFPTIAAAPYFRFSVDGGATYLQGGNTYFVQSVVANGTALVPNRLQSSFAPLAGGDTTEAVFGSLNFQPTGVKWFQGNSVVTVAGSGPIMTTICGHLLDSSVATHILLGFVNANIMKGRVRLSGAAI